MQSIGYKELYDYVKNGIDDNTKLTECIESIKQNSRHYAKRQITWFKNKSDAKWIDMEKYLNELASYKE